MLVNRRTFAAKKGRMDDAVAVLKEAAELINRSLSDATCRICRSDIGPFDTLAIEVEYESLAEYHRLATEYFASPEMASLLDKWNEVAETGGTNDIWTLVEQ